MGTPRVRSLVRRQWKEHRWELADRSGVADWLWRNRRGYAVQRSPGGHIRCYTPTNPTNKWKFIIFR